MSSVEEERIREIVRDEIDHSGHRLSRRGLLAALGLTGGAAALSGSAAAEEFANAGQGQVGTPQSPLAAVHADQGNFEAADVEELTLNGETRTSWPSGGSSSSEVYVSDGDGVDRQIWVIENGASDPAGAAADDIIFEKES